MQLVSGFASPNIDCLAPLGTFTSVIQTTSGAHGRVFSQFRRSESTARIGFAVGTEGLVETARDNSDLALKLTEADGLVVSTTTRPTVLNLDLPPADAIKRLTMVSERPLGRQFATSQGGPIDLQEVVPES